MASQHVCDRCGSTTPFSDSEEVNWLTVNLHKLASSSIVKAYDLCKNCSNHVRRLLQESPPIDMGLSTNE